jgi:hypothetical protein
MKLSFKIDKKYDEEKLLEFLSEIDVGDKKQIADLIRIDSEDVDVSLFKKMNGAKIAVHSLVSKKYKEILTFIKNSVVGYQKSWDNINDDFSSMVEKKTGSPWKFKKYFCVVSAYHEGISSWGGNVIARRWSINADTQRPVTAHELALSHFWSILEENSASKRWSNNKKWEYSEILSWCLLGLDNDFHKFWPWQLKKHSFPLCHNYPQIVPLQKEMKKIYLASNNFVEFLGKSIEYGKNKDA